MNLKVINWALAEDVNVATTLRIKVVLKTKKTGVSFL